jgi:hypothetical protein
MLSTLLYSEVSQQFLRILGSGNSPIYIDAVDALSREMGEAALGISRQEAIELVALVVEKHAGLQADVQEQELASGDLVSPRAQAGFVLNRLIAAGWLSEPQRPDYQRIIYLERSAEILIEALRQIATPDAAQFTDKLQFVCMTLVNPAAFDQNPWSDLEACISNAKLGIAELRGMQTSVERMIRRQLEVRTLRENLSVLYDDFSDAIGHSCYRELVRVRLPFRLRQARKRLDELASDSSNLERMQTEVLRRNLFEDPASAMAHVRLRIDELSQLLDAIEPQAEKIDHRTAEFARRSFARFRYLQEVGSVRRVQIQSIFEFINKKFGNERLSDIDIDLPKLLLPEVKLLSGLESLYLPRRSRQPCELAPVDAEPDDAEREACLLEMESTLRDSMTVLRANRFVEQLPFGERKVLSSSELPIRNDEEIADLASVLLHAESDDACFQVRTARETGAMIETDRKVGFLIERFDLERK